jgi:hypothetical protein
VLIHHMASWYEPHTSFNVINFNRRIDLISFVICSCVASEST